MIERVQSGGIPKETTVEIGRMLQKTKINRLFRLVVIDLGF